MATDLEHRSVAIAILFLPKRCFLDPASRGPDQAVARPCRKVALRKCQKEEPRERARRFPTHLGTIVTKTGTDSARWEQHANRLTRTHAWSSQSSTEWG